MPEGELQNVILSRNPCPICIDAADQEPRSYIEWAASEWGLPGSSARYCEDDCHCILVPVDMLGELPGIDELIKLRGEEGSDLANIIEISTAEAGLKHILDEWIRKYGYGKLPPEIYDMDVFEVEAYLRKLMKKLETGQ